MKAFLSRIFGRGKENSYEDDINYCYNAFITGSEAERVESIQKIINYSHYSNDLSLLNFRVATLLAYSNISTRIVGFRAASIFLHPSSPQIELLPAAIDNALQTPELVTHALRTICYICSPYIFEPIQPRILQIAESSSSDINRIFALHVLFKAYLYDNTVVSAMIPLLKSALKIPSMKFATVTILTEISMDHSDQLEAILQPILSEISLWKQITPIYFSKLSRLLKQLLKNSNADLQQLEKSLDSLLSSTTSPMILYDMANLISAYNFTKNIYHKLGNKIHEILLDPLDPNSHTILLLSLEKILGRYKPDTAIVSTALQSKDVALQGPALLIRAVTSSSRETISNLCTFAKANKDTFTILEFLKMVNVKGSGAVKTLFELYRLEIPGTITTIANSLKQANDEETQQCILKKARKLFEPPDDEFGIALGDVITSWSMEPEDIGFILPATLSQKSIRLQAALINDAILLWIRLGFKVQKGYIHRLQLLAQSPHHEVGQPAAMFLQLIKCAYSK